MDLFFNLFKVHRRPNVRTIIFKNLIFEIPGRPNVGFPVGWAQITLGADLRSKCYCFEANPHVKTKELGLVVGGSSHKIVK